jgi:hypothetical protein
MSVAFAPRTPAQGKAAIAKSAVKVGGEKIQQEG